MDADLYDEFGNYIGPELESDEESEDEDDEREEEPEGYVSLSNFFYRGIGLDPSIHVRLSRSTFLQRPRARSCLSLSYY